MPVRCKFNCVSKREILGWGTDNALYFDYEFTAVIDGSPENKEFWKWTPSGKLNVTSVKNGQFTVGKAYYIDITEA